MQNQNGFGGLGNRKFQLAFEGNEIPGGPITYGVGFAGRQFLAFHTVMAGKYDELGLVNTKEMFNKALAEGYAVPAFNFNNLEQLQGILTGCAQTRSPVILQVSGSARKYISPEILPHLVRGGIEMVRGLGSAIPIALHLDHGDTFDLAKACIDTGFSSVMIDGSHHSFEDNVKLTKQVVEYAHELGVTVEGELGVLAGIEDEVVAEASHYTRPEEVEEFVARTGVDSLAISIGTSHGAYKFKPKPGEEPPPLRFDILAEVERRVPKFPHRAARGLLGHAGICGDD